MNDSYNRLIEVRLADLVRRVDDVDNRLVSLENEGGHEGVGDYVFSAGEDRSLDRGEPMPFDIAVLKERPVNGSSVTWKTCVYIPRLDLVTLDGDHVSDASDDPAVGWRVLDDSSGVSAVWLVVWRYTDSSEAYWRVVRTEPPSSKDGCDFYVVICLADTESAGEGTGGVYRQLFHGSLALSSGRGGGGGPDSTEELELRHTGPVANTDTWSYGMTNGSGALVHPKFVPYRVYYDDSYHRLLGFYRTATYNAEGMLTEVSEETQVEIFTAVREMP